MKKRSYHEKSSLPIAVRVSKTHVLKLPNYKKGEGGLVKREGGGTMETCSLREGGGQHVNFWESGGGGNWKTVFKFQVPKMFH